MSTMLNFKYGLHKNLPAYSSANVGSIYVTTDEQAMYVDLPAGRIRVSQLITLSDITAWENLTPPYSTEAFYYIADANALLKYNGEKGWTQINSTKAVQDALDTLEANMNVKFDEVNKDLADHLSQIKNLGSVLGYIGSFANESAITAKSKNDVALIGGVLKIYNGTAWTSWNDVAEHIVNIEDDVNDLTAASNNHEARLQTAETDIGNLKTDLASEVQRSTKKDEAHDADIATLKSGLAEEITRATGVEEKLRTDLTAETERATKAEQQNAADIATNATAIAAEVNRATAAEQSLQDQITSNDGDIAKLREDLTKETDRATAAEEDLKNQILSNDADIAANAAAITKEIQDREAAIKHLQDQIDQEGTDLSDLQAALEAETQARTDADNALSGRINNNAADIATNASNISTNASNIATNKKAIEDEVTRSTAQDTAHTKDIAANKLAIETEKNRAEAAEATLTANLEQEISDRKQAIDDLTKEVTDNMQAADAMKFMGTVKSAAELLTKEAGAEIGHTYKATAEFGVSNDVTVDFANDESRVYIGDLLIASGTETDGKITGDVIWLHVPSGYIADYNPELSISGTDNTATVRLTSGAANSGVYGDLGSYDLIAATNSCVTIETDNASKVTIGMAWGTF